MDVQDRRQPPSAGTGRRCQPGVDRPARPVDVDLRQLDGGEAPLPSGPLAGDRAKGPVLDGADLARLAVERGADGDTAAGDLDARAGDAGRRVGQRRGDTVEADPVRDVAAAVADDHAERGVVQPDRARRVLGQHQVTPRPVAGRAVQRCGERPRPARRQLHHPHNGRNLVGRVVHVGPDERQLAAVRREAGPIRVAGQARQRTDARPGGVGAHRPELETRMDRGVGPSIRAEGDPAPVRRPRRVEDVEVAARQLARPRSLPRVDQPQVRAPHDVAALVVAEVEPGEAARHRRPSLSLLADQEAMVARLGDERQALAVGAPVDARDAVLEIREPPRLAAVERKDPRLPDRVVDARRRAHEGNPAAVRRHGWRSISHPSAGQLSRATSAKGARPQVRLVAHARNPAQRVDDGIAIGSQPERFEGDLGAHQGPRSGIDHDAGVCPADSRTGCADSAMCVRNVDRIPWGVRSSRGRSGRPAPGIHAPLLLEVWDGATPSFNPRDACLVRPAPRRLHGRAAGAERWSRAPEHPARPAAARRRAARCASAPPATRTASTPATGSSPRRTRSTSSCTTRRSRSTRVATTCRSWRPNGLPATTG